MYVYPYCNALSARFFAVDRALNSYFMIMIIMIINLQIPFCPWRLENLSPIVGFLCQKYANIDTFKQTVLCYYEFSNTVAFRCWTVFNCDSFKSSLSSVFW